MEESKSKRKNILLNVLFIFCFIMYCFVISAIFVALNVDTFWGDMLETEKATIGQVFTLAAYRLLLYVPFPLLFATIRYDNRHKYSGRVLVWYNQMFLILLIIYAIYDFFAIYLCTQIKILDALSSFALILGYIFTYIKKEKVSFAEPENILK